jgi:hypothetical protein
MATGVPTLLHGGGLAAARIKPKNYVPAHGEWCFAVGSDEPGVHDYVEVGEYAGVKQVVDVTNLTTISFAVALRNTEGLAPATVRGRDVTYPTGFTGGEQLQLETELGVVQVITFQATDQNLDEVVARINATLQGAEAEADNGQLRITTTAKGPTATLANVSGTALSKLGITAGTYVGARISFRAVVLLYGSEVMTITAAPGQMVDFRKRTINVSKLMGDRELELRVEAIA